MAYIVMAYRVMAYRVMAYLAMAYRVMACIGRWFGAASKDPSLTLAVHSYGLYIIMAYIAMAKETCQRTPRSRSQALTALPPACHYGLYVAIALIARAHSVMALWPV